MKEILSIIVNNRLQKINFIFKLKILKIKKNAKNSLLLKNIKYFNYFNNKNLFFAKDKFVKHR